MKTARKAAADSVQDQPRDTQSLSHCSATGADRLADGYQRGDRETVHMPDVTCPLTVIGDVSVVTAPEQIDIGTAYGLRAALASAARGQATVVVDMTRTRCCDAVGLHVLVRAHKRALAAGGELRLVTSSAEILRLFAITGIDRVIRHHASMDEALAYLPPARASRRGRVTRLDDGTTGDRRRRA
jgi:anti-sigma B factor antagonist